MRDLPCTDKEIAEFIAMLMVLAKALDQIRNSAHLPEEEAAELGWQAHSNLFGLAHRLYPNAGVMEQRVVAFADQLGFGLRERYFAVSSNATH